VQVVIEIALTSLAPASISLVAERASRSAPRLMLSTVFGSIGYGAGRSQPRCCTPDRAILQMQRPPLLDGILERTATRFLRRIHRVTHRMPIKLRAIEKQRILVVAPHPDDEVIAVGGNLALHQRLGSEVLTLFVTLD